MGRRRILRDKVEPSIELDSHLSDGEIFDAAMEGVRKLQPAKRRLRREFRASIPDPDPDPASEQSEYLKTQPMEIHHHPDYIEGGVGSWDRRLLRRLRRGDFSIQENLDLHGLTQTEARQELDQFLREAAVRGLSCVRVIHGKGKNSPQGRAILRDKVPDWLSTRSNARLVIAFTSASLWDGGSGATYVLLRTRQGAAASLPRRRPGRKRS